MLYIGLNLFYCIVKLTYVSYNFSVLQVSNPLRVTLCFKNTSDADKAIEDHALATHVCISVYKTEKDLIQKVNMQSDRKITKLIYYFSMLTKWLFD